MTIDAESVVLTRGTGRTRLPAGERRRAILDGSLAAFVERGYDAASIGEIARRSGVSKAVIYDHFESKRELFEELLQALMQEMLERIVGQIELDAKPAEQLRAGIDGFLRFTEERPAAHRLLFTLAGDPAAAEVCRRVQRQTTQTLVWFLDMADGLVIGEDREGRIELIAEFIKGMLSSLAAWRLENPEIPREQLVERAWLFAGAGVGSLGGAVPWQPVL